VGKRGSTRTDASFDVEGVVRCQCAERKGRRGSTRTGASFDVEGLVSQ
jgi:hypothetical protein